MATYQDVEQMIRAGLTAEELESVLADDSTAVTDEQANSLMALWDDLAAMGIAPPAELAVWSLCVDGDGDHPDSATGLADEDAAVEWAEGLIRKGDWEPGNVVTYYLSREGVRTDTTHTVAI